MWTRLWGWAKEKNEERKRERKRNWALIYTYKKNVPQPPAERLNLNHRFWSQRYHDRRIFVRTATMVAVFFVRAASYSILW